MNEMTTETVLPVSIKMSICKHRNCSLSNSSNFTVEFPNNSQVRP